MTDDEKKAQMTARNAAIVASYQAGRKVREVASEFKLGRQRIMQILKAGGVWQPYEKGSRTKFLGVNISEETKDALRVKADAEGKSVSRFASDVLDEVVLCRSLSLPLMR